MATEARKRTPWYLGPKLDVSRDKLAALEAEGRWVIEEKFDGNWCLAKLRDGAIAEMESRVGLGLGSSMVGMQVFESSIDALLVGELTADLVDGGRHGTRRLYVYDLLELSLSGGIQTVGLKEHVLAERRQLLETLMEPVENDRFMLIEQRDSGFVDFYDEVTGRGGEGVVVKRTDSVYRTKSASGKTDKWVRCKPRRTADFVVMGFTLAEKGTLVAQLGLYKPDEQEPTFVQRVVIPKEMRDVLEEGDVVEVLGQELYENSRVLRFGHIERIRDDKPAEDCRW